MGEMALRDIGMDTIYSSDFRKDPNTFPDSLQETAIRKYLNKNKSYLGYYLKTYPGKTINDILITKSGILAAAHLVGHGKVKLWLQNDGNVNITDGNGVTIEHYMETFKGFDI